MNKIKNRIYSLDCSRALCMLWIVGFWHLKEYCSQINVNNFIIGNVKFGVLATFTFISGYFLGKKDFKNAEQVIDFYKKRVIRILPLLLLSCLCFLIINVSYGSSLLSQVKSCILTVLGLSCIFTPAPQTIWYISMLILFYIITPIICKSKSIPYRLIISLIVFVIFITLKHLINIDERVLIYYPFYVLGLLNIKENFIKDNFKWYVLLISFICFLGYSFLSYYLISYDIVFINEYALSFFGVIMIIELGKLLYKAAFLCNFLTYVSYASMAAYLFHRQLFFATRLLIGDFKIWVAYLLVLPFLLIASFWLQKAYDFFIKKSSKLFINTKD